MAGKIFINYRCGLCSQEAEHLYAQLHRYFPERKLFLDRNKLHGGDKWLLKLQREVAMSRVMLVLIAEGWADLRDEKGLRRLENNADFVRFEIGQALMREIPVIPILLNGAELPVADQLPVEIQPLLARQAMRLRAESFTHDSDLIAARIKKALAERKRSGVPGSAVVAVSAAALVVGALAGPYLGVMGPATDQALKTALEAAQKEAKRERDGAQTARKETQTQLEAARRVEKELTEEKIRTRAVELERDQARKALQEKQIEANNDRAALEKELAKLRQEIKQQTTTASAPPKFSENTTQPTAGETFRDCPDCPEMVKIPADSFQMGSPPGEPDREDDEAQHKVIIRKAFAVGKYAVTFAEWDACVADGGCGGYKPSDEGWGREDRPVINVSWNDAQSYVKWLSRKTGKSYRLPSEAEREYFTRAGTTTPFWWGSSITPDQANYDCSVDPYKGGRKGEYRRKTVPVNTFKPNPWGLYQVHGNVWEWVEDCYEKDYAKAPADGSANTTSDCSFRVLRGGSWVNDPQILRAANRYGFQPGYRYVGIGLRVARTL